MKNFLAHGRADFLAGLAVVLPAAISVAVVGWLFGTVAHFTDALLLFVPEEWTRTSEGTPQAYWSVAAFLLGILLIGLVGRIGRYYFGRKLIQGVDAVLMRVPLLNKMYLALRQIHEALTSSKAASFKQVVLVEYPRAGLYSIGFVTGAQNAEVQAKTRKRLLGVFVPTPPLTSGSIVLVPESDVVKLEMSVADGLKFIMSLGSVCPAYPSAEKGLPTLAVGDPEEPGRCRSGDADGGFVAPALAPRPFSHSALSEDHYELAKPARVNTPETIG